MLCKYINNRLLASAKSFCIDKTVQIKLDFLNRYLIYVQGYFHVILLTSYMGSIGVKEWIYNDYAVKSSKWNTLFTISIGN